MRLPLVSLFDLAVELVHRGSQFQKSPPRLGRLNGLNIILSQISAQIPPRGCWRNQLQNRILFFMVNWSEKSCKGAYGHDSSDCHHRVEARLP